MTNQQELDKLIEETGRKVVSCACNKCANMCKHAPCIGTPSDILRLYNNGYGKYLRGFIWATGMQVGWGPIKMVQIAHTAGKACPLLTKDNLCMLHAVGIKPTEGKLALHGPKEVVKPSQHPAFAVAKTWLDPANFKTIKLILKARTTYEKDL